MSSLTKRQLQVLEYIQGYIKTNHYAPSYREIMQHFSFSSLGTVYRYVQILKTKGKISLKKQSSRSLEPLEEEKLIDLDLKLPLIGSISYGEALEMFPKSHSFSVPKQLVSSPDTTYVMQVQGSGFIEELIADGDYLLIEAREEAEPGETIVALLNQTEVIIKKYFLEDSYVRLVSHNVDNHPLIVHAEDIFIQGVIIGAIRNLKKM